MLLDALDLLERNDGRAHDTIRAIRESDGLEGEVNGSNGRNGSS